MRYESCYCVRQKCKQEIRENYCTVYLYNSLLRFLTFEIQNTFYNWYVQCYIRECYFKIVIIEELLIIQGYQSMRLQRRLCGINTVCYLILMVSCNFKLVSFCVVLKTDKHIILIIQFDLSRRTTYFEDLYSRQKNLLNLKIVIEKLIISYLQSHPLREPLLSIVLQIFLIYRIKMRV